MKRCALIAMLIAAPAPQPVHAFCGFYVGGADASLYADATMVVLMREGTHTVLSMQNSYDGPPEGFALIVPVPEVLQEDNVRTLPASIFERVDRLAAPRLVEYWEQDPCYVPPRRHRNGRRGIRRRRMSEPSSELRRDLGVTVEAEFAVGEYDIVILGAEDSTGLETWLHRENYAIPEGARRVLSPYVQLGTKFFVAKVDSERVTFVDGRAVLSPLRVDYDSEQFSLPVRLGLLNSRGEQNLIIHILAKAQRYEMANYANVMIPTNLRVDDQVRETFGPFYRALFDRVVEQNPGAVVTEYSWRATSCDPCPTTPLQAAELNLLGADVIMGGQPSGLGQPGRTGGMAQRLRSRTADFTLTRMHHRYTADDLDRDLVFRTAPAIIGGRGMPDTQGTLQEKHALVQTGGVNNFQGRYVILHEWEGEVACAHPRRGRWGGPPTPDQDLALRMTPVAAPSPLRDPAPSRRSTADLSALVQATDQPFLAVQATPASDTSLGVLPEPEPEPQPEPNPQPVATTPVAEPGAGGCASCSASNNTGAAFATLALLAAFMRRPR